jgi:hypothetical protein
LSHKAHYNYLPVVGISGEESSVRIIPIMIQNNVILTPVLRVEIIAAQSGDAGVAHIKKRLTEGDPKVNCFRVDEEGTLWFNDRFVVPKNHELRKKIFDEARTSKYSKCIDSTGKVKGGMHCRRSLEKTYKSEHDISKKVEYMSTPSPTIPSMQSPWTDFLQEEQAYTYIGLNNDVHHSQYRTMAKKAAMEAQTNEEAQATREAQNDRDASACSEPHTSREVQTTRDTSGSKKSKRNYDALMDELISL